MSARLSFIVTYFTFVFFFFTFFASGVVDSQDGNQYLAIARRMYYDHSLELPPEQFPDQNIHMNTTSRSQRYSPTGLGFSLAMMPAVVIEDVFLQATNTERISGFPLHSDWPVLLFASMINSFFGAFLVVVLYLYLRSYNIEHKTAIFLSFIGVIGTNLFVYAKHVFPHMMFTSFLTFTFYCVRMFSVTKKRMWLLFAGMAYGVVVLSYNPTFLLAAPALALYYLLLIYPLPTSFSLLTKQFQTKSRIKLFTKLKDLVKNTIFDVAAGVTGILPLWLLYAWFNTMRFGDPVSAGYGSGIPLPGIPAAYIIFEGIWGLLFSPGRSIFVYSPILLALTFFWWKLDKKLLPEIISFSILSIIYVIFFGTLTGSPTYMVWHGESSWGNRYVVAIIPLLWILLSHIFIKLHKWEKWLVFMPLVLIGLTVQLIGILLPYQIKRAGLPLNLYITEDRSLGMYHFTHDEYPNFFPRFSPVFLMSKTLVKRIKALPKMYDHGTYNLRLIDGFDGPYDLGWTTWRGVRSLALLKFDNHSVPPERVRLRVRNHVSDPASSLSAQLSYQLNEQNLVSGSIIPPNEERNINIEVLRETLKEKNNTLRLELTFEGSSSATLVGKQLVFLQGVYINDQPQNISTMDYPFISPISQALIGTDYVYWGNVQNDHWDTWYYRSSVYEQTFDLWWLRPLHYWDLPKDFFAGLFVINAVGILYFGTKVIRD